MGNIILISNIPAPYREKVHEIVGNYFRNNYHVIYCNKIEPNREWKIEEGNYSKSFLEAMNLSFKNNYIHIDFSIWKELDKYNPKVVITTGFGPTMFLAFIWCKTKKRKHISFTDGTIKSERYLTLMHKVIRKVVFSSTDAFIGASNKSMELYMSYGINKKLIFISQLCADNDYYRQFVNAEKKYDIMFCGQFIEGKMPLFFVEIAKNIKEKIGKCKVLIIGSGPLKDQILNQLNKYKIDYYYPGFIQQADLPIYYASSKVLLFPTKKDSWGVVANEACAVGVPVITCENAGVAHELIKNNYNGFVLQLDIEIWTKHVIQLLTNKELYDVFSDNAFKSVQKYNYENAADGIIKAVEYVLNK